MPTDLLNQKWQQIERNSEKYFDPLLAVLMAIAETGQSDANTVDALIKRLEFGDDPPWLRGDVIGTLTAVTGQRFAYDVDSWKTWWGQQSKN